MVVDLPFRIIVYWMMSTNTVSDYPERDYRISSLVPTSSAILLVVVLAFALRVSFLDVQSLWRDEVDALNFATAPWSEVLANFLRPGWNGPLYFLLLRGWVFLAGRTAFALRFFSLLWGVLEVPLIYVLARRRFGRVTARGAAFLVAFSPYLVWYSAEVKMYTWTPMLILLGFYALDRACAAPHWYWWAIVLSGISFAMYSHILAALMIPVGVLWFALQEHRHGGAWIGALATLGLLTLPYLPLVAWQLPMVLQDRGVTGFPPFTLPQMAGTLLVAWSAGIPGRGRIAAMGVYAGLCLWGVRELVIRKLWRSAGRLLTWVFVPILSIWLLSLRGPLFTDRYLIWVAPAFYLLVAIGLASIRKRWVSAAIWLSLLLFGWANLSMQFTHPFKPQFRAAAADLRRRRLPDELLLFQIPYNRVMLAYYDPVSLDPWAEAPYTNYRDSEGRFTVTGVDVDAQLQSLTSGYDRVWLVYSEATLWDERELVKSWLDLRGRVDYEQHFVMVSLYRYALD